MSNPALEVLCKQLREREVPPDATHEELRQGLEDFLSSFHSLEGMNQEAVNAQGVEARWVRAAGIEPVGADSDGTAPDGAGSENNRMKGAVLYLHGGAYVRGSVQSHLGVINGLGRQCGLPVLAPEYRLAPEHPWPAAMEDVAACYHWLLQQKFHPSRIFLAGDSAGGGLTLASLLAWRDAGAPLPAAALLLSPWTDLTLSGESVALKAEQDPMLTRETLLECAALYLNGADPKHPYISPMFSEPKGLPPMLIQVGSAEILLDDSIRMAEKLREAGVETVLEEWPDMIHVWQVFASRLVEGQQALQRAGEFIRAYLPENS